MKSLYKYVAKSILLLMMLSISQFVLANDEYKNCLHFSISDYGEDRGRILKSKRVPEELLSKHKVFIAKFDLNDDGVGELFHYIEAAGFCGNQSGCYINVFDGVSGKKLKKFGFPTNWEFKPEKDVEYLCILNEKRNGYFGLIKNQKWQYTYDGKTFTGKK